MPSLLPARRRAVFVVVAGLLALAGVARAADPELPPVPADPVPEPAPEPIASAPTPPSPPLSPEDAREAIVEEVPWWLGLPVANVSFSAPEGGAPEESLEPLMRAKQGFPLDPHTIALDLTTLFQVGEFSAVQAEVHPWVIEDYDGNPVPAVDLTYVVYPAPVIAKKPKIISNKRFRDQALLAESGLARGQVFYAELDGPPAERRLEHWLASKGWTDARVGVRSTEPEPGQINVSLVVDEGEPSTLQRLTFKGDLEGVATEAQLRRWARHAGVAEGRPLAAGAVLKAQDEIRTRLGTMRGGWFRPRSAWIEARVTPIAIRTAEGVRITYAIEPGSQLQLDVTGASSRTVEAGLGIDHRTRLTRGFLDQAADRLVSALQEDGWLDATATVDPPDEHTPGIKVLTVHVDRGGRAIIGDLPDVGNQVDFGFELTDVPKARDRTRQKRELQAVFDQASPDVLRRDYYTVREMEVGLAAARQYYVDRGYLEAELKILDPIREPRPSVANAWRSLAGKALNTKVTPRVEIARGQVTTLSSLEVQGAAANVGLDEIEEARQQRIGEPFSPQEIDTLAHDVVEAHRAAGYLEADARVQHGETGPHERGSVILVNPGAKLLLRSVVIRGARFTKTSFVQHEVDLPIGQPITSTALEGVRSDLYDLSIFRSVDLKLLGDEEARDLIVTLDERPRTEIEIGPGVSTDQGIRAVGRFTRYNTFGTAQRFDAVGQIGFQFRSEQVTDWLPDLEHPEWRGALSYTAPRFPLHRTQLVTDVLLRERRQERTWQMDRTGGGVAIQAEVGKTQLRGGARVEARELTEVDIGALLPGEPWTRLVIEGDTVHIPSNWRWQESLTGLAVFDFRDDKLAPTKGSLVSWTGEFVPGIPWDDFVKEQYPVSFLKNDLRYSLYVPLGGLTVHGAVGGGYIRPFQGLPPLEDRYRLGGTGSMRGFVRDAVGPQNRAKTVQVDWPNGIGPVVDYALRDEAERWTPTGGDTSASGTVELLMPLPELGLVSWEGYALEGFCDFGNVWLLSADANSESEPALPPFRYSVGMGGRVSTPIGPLQIDLAVNPLRLYAPPAQLELLRDKFREPTWRAHLALGALF